MVMSALRALARRRFEDREPPALTGEAAASARAVVPVREPAGIGADDALWSEIQARRAIRDAIASVRRMSY